MHVIHGKMISKLIQVWREHISRYWTTFAHFGKHFRSFSHCKNRAKIGYVAWHVWGAWDSMVWNCKNLGTMELV